MKVYALLSYFDERPEHLTRCVRSLEGFCDHVIALDGPYPTFHGERAYDAAEQRTAIHDEPCKATTSRYQGSEVQKRAALFELGRREGATPDDWFLVIDADETLAEFSPDAHAWLKFTKRDVAEVRFCGVQINGVVSHTARERRLYRALPGLTVERTHWLYTVPNGEERRFMWRGPDGHLSGEPVLDLFGHVTMHHYNGSRDGARKRRALDYYATRDAAGLETVGRDWTGLGELA